MKLYLKFLNLSLNSYLKLYLIFSLTEKNDSLLRCRLYYLKVGFSGISPALVRAVPEKVMN